MRKKNFGARKMAEAAAYLERMRDAVIFAGGKMGPFEQRPNWICRAATRLGIDPSRAAGYFYKKLTVVPAWEHDAVMQRVAQLEHRAEAREHELQTLADVRARLVRDMDGLRVDGSERIRPMGDGPNGTTGTEG